MKQVWIDRKKALKLYFADMKLAFLMCIGGTVSNLFFPTRDVIGIYIGMWIGILSFFTFLSYVKKEEKNEFKGDI